MSIYTTQLRWIVERLQTQAGSDPNDFSACYKYLGLNDYPIFDESYRATLNDKIIRHFYFREIGFETAAQFAWFMRRTMHENMPYFNQLYESQNLVIDPLTNRKYTWSETYELAQGGSTTTTDSESTTTELQREDNTTDNVDYGKVNTKETEYGRTGTKETEYGRTDTETDTYGKTTSDTTTTEYGRTQSTVNGGSDESLEGGMHERVIRSDTPMNQISNQGVENLNYATDVTYTDRDATSATVTEYGGTTDIANGGEDVTTSTGSVGGTDTKRNATSGTDAVTESLGGTDTETDTTSGTDERSVEYTRSDVGGGTRAGTSATERDLDESGTKTHTVNGYDGLSPADLLMRWRDTFLNIDMQVMASLETLFFGLWM